MDFTTDKLVAVQGQGACGYGILNILSAMSAIPSHLISPRKHLFSRYFTVVFTLFLLLMAAGQRPACALDLNLASKEQLLGLKGIGSKTADKILTARKDRPFHTTADFTSRVPGFGVKKLRKLQEQGLTIGGQPLQVPTAKLATAAKRPPRLRPSLSSQALPALPLLIRPAPPPGQEHVPGPATADGKTR